MNTVGIQVRVIRGKFAGRRAVTVEAWDESEVWHFTLAQIDDQGNYVPDEELDAAEFLARDLWPVWLDDVRCSVYRCSTDNVGVVASLSSFLLSQRHRDEILRLRQLPEMEQKEAKKSLPMATLSGMFSPRRKAQYLVRHTGIICIDVDPDADNVGRWGPDLAAIPALMRRVPYVFYVAHSCRGVGYFALAKCDPTQPHKQVFAKVERDFAEMGIKIDHSCSDVSRPRFLSFDEDAWWQLDCETIHVESDVTTATDDQFHIAPAQPYIQVQGTLPAGQGSGRSLSPFEWEKRKIELCIDEVEARQLDITGSYQECLNLGACLYGLGTEGFDLWWRLCRLRGSNHSQMRTKKELAVKWMSLRTITGFSGDESRMNGFFATCRRYGVSYMDAIERQKQQRGYRYRRHETNKTY